MVVFAGDNKPYKNKSTYAGSGPDDLRACIWIFVYGYISI